MWAFYFMSPIIFIRKKGQQETPNIDSKTVEVTSGAWAGAMPSPCTFVFASPLMIMARKKIDIPTTEISRIYYSSRSHSQASNMLSQKYGLTPRAWRYRLRRMEELKLLSPSSLKYHKKRDLLRIETLARRRERKEVEVVGEVMLTVHFKIHYRQIGAKGFHPFFLEGYFSRRVPRDYPQAVVIDMMNWVYGKLSEFGALTQYLEINKEDYEQGVEVEELSETRKRDNEFKYDYRRRG